MRKQQLQLLLLGFAPTPLVVLLCLALLYRRPDLVDLLLAVVATAATLACNILLKGSLRTFLLQPLTLLARHIAALEPGHPVPTRPPLLEPVVIALEQRMAQLVAMQNATTGALRQDNAHLRKLVGDLREAVVSLQESENATYARTRFAEQYGAAIAAATSVPLTGVISCVNRLVADDIVAMPCTGELVTNASALAFLVRELEGFDYGNDSESRFDIRQVTDETISAISTSQSHVRRILPFYDRFGQKRFIGNQGRVKSLIFNYLLAGVLRTDADSLVLHVNYMADGQLSFALSPAVANDALLHDRRLIDLMTSVDAGLQNGMLTIPLADDGSFTQPDVALRAMVLSNDGPTQASLIARLESMRVDIVDRRYDADVCLSSMADTHEIMALRRNLPDDTRLLLFGNDVPLPLPDTRQLSWPALHGELAAELLELTERRSVRAPLVLAVDDNDSNLKLLELQLRQLGTNVETARDAATALALARRHAFSLIVVDMHLPDATGLEVAAAIKAQALHQSPVVILTAHISEEDKHRAFEAGISNVLVKPVTRSSLKQMLVSLHLIAAAPPTEHRPPTTANHTITLALFDHPLSLQLADNRPELADEMLEGVVAALPQERDAINDAFQCRQMEPAGSLLHRLHGALHYCGLPRLKNAVSRLETIVCDGREQEINLALKRFNAEVDALLEWYDPGGNYFETGILPAGTPD